jgi:Lon protease-like protein
LIIADKSAEVFAEPHELASASWVGYRLAEILPVPLSAKQKLLELDGALARLEILYRFLEQRGLVGA